MTTSVNEYHKEYNRKRRQRLKQQGLCSRCGKIPSESMCTECKEKIREKQRDPKNLSRRRQHQSLTQVREQKRLYQLTPERVNWRRQHLYGLSPEGYDRLLENQNGVCAICKRPGKKLNIDHNHTTDEVRGLLCSRCNLLVGFVENYDGLLVAAQEYLLAMKNLSRNQLP